MITDSPHLYRGLGERTYRSRGEEAEVAESIISASLMQAQLVEGRGLSAVLTLNHLSYQTGASYGFLRDICERVIDPYSNLAIKRKNGRSMRPISIPNPILMDVQRWVLGRILATLPVHHNSYAYAAGKSIRQCAQKHLGARWLVKLDIRDFFQSINEVQVYSVFEDVGYQPLISLELARICTRYAEHAAHIDIRRYRARRHYTIIKAYKKPLLGFVPQGAPTSGALANHVSYQLDIKLTELADSHNVVYTRYADDLTFSSSSDFDRSVALDLIKETRRILRSERFVMHEQKTSIVPPGARKIVLGLLVDGGAVRISRWMRGKIEHHVRGVETFGLTNHVLHSDFSSIDGFVRHVSGTLAFTYDIEPDWTSRMGRRWRTTLQSNGWVDMPIFF